jgi:hypothetical protein
MPRAYHVDVDLDVNLNVNRNVDLDRRDECIGQAASRGARPSGVHAHGVLAQERTGS